jgi:hypothetical protein
MILHTILLLTLSLQEYTANSHLLLINLTSALNLPLKFFHAEEATISAGLATVALEMSPEEFLAQKAEESKAPRKWKGRYNGPIVQTTLAPALESAGLGTVHGSHGLPPAAVAALLGSMADCGRIIGGLFGMNPARPVGKMMESFAREILDFGFLPIHDQERNPYRDARQRPAEERRLRLVIAMSGWILDDDDVVVPWLCLGHQAESYAVRWDLTALLNLGSSLETVVKSLAWNQAKIEINSKTSESSWL